MVLSGGDGTTPSDDGKLLVNLYRWLAEPGVQAGGTGVPPPPPITFNFQRVLDWDTLTMPSTWRHRAIPQKIDRQMYYDELPDPTITGELHYYKALIGLHSAYSDGRGSVAEYAAAPEKAGYSLIAFTETFEKLGGPDRWEALRHDCVKHTSDSFVCLPGIDIADPEGGRYLIFGQPNYPSKAWLSEDRLVDKLGEAAVILLVLDGVPFAATRHLGDEVEREGQAHLSDDELYLALLPTLTHINKPSILLGSHADLAGDVNAGSLSVRWGLLPERVDVYLFGSLFYGCKLKVEKQDTMRLFMIGNAAKLALRFVEYNPADAFTDEALQGLLRAFDDLRRLGEMDLELNHPEVR